MHRFLLGVAAVLGLGLVLAAPSTAEARWFGGHGHSYGYGHGYGHGSSHGRR